VIVQGVKLETSPVETENVAVEESAATVIEVGTCAKALFEVRLTTAPLAETGPLNVTFPCEAVPPRTVLGTNVSEVMVAGNTVKEAVTVVVPDVADMVATVEDATLDVVIEKVAVVDPATTVTVPGVTTFALFDDNCKTAPPDGAGPFNVTVPVDEIPLGTDVGETARLVGEGGKTVIVAEAGSSPQIAIRTTDVFD